MPEIEERRRKFKPYYLLIGGERNGDVVWWPRTDLQPCHFLIDSVSIPAKTTGWYWPYERVFLPQGGSAEPAVFYRVAFAAGYYQHPTLDPDIAYRIVNLSLEDLTKIRVEKEE